MSSEAQRHPDIAMAQTDQELRKQLQTFFGTADVIPGGATGLSHTSAKLTEMAIRLGRSKYSEQPERLRAVLSTSSKENAVAIWTDQGDWVVLSAGLMLRLAQTACTSSEVLTALDEVSATELVRKLGQLAPCPGLPSALASALFIAAWTFFCGHEIGHHLAGHDGYYRVLGAVQECEDDALSEGMERQALELVADDHGVAISLACTGRFLMDAIDGRVFTPTAEKEYQTMLTTLVSVGSLLALAVFQPRPVDLKSQRSRTHPPSSLRALWIASRLIDAMGRAIPSLSKQELHDISYVSMELAALASIAPGSNLAAQAGQRSGRHEPVAIRVLGIRKVLFDPNAGPYLKELLTRGEALKQRLRPRQAL